MGKQKKSEKNFNGLNQTVRELLKHYYAAVNQITKRLVAVKGLSLDGSSTLVEEAVKRLKDLEVKVAPLLSAAGGGATMPTVFPLFPGPAKRISFAATTPSLTPATSSLLESSAISPSSLTALAATIHLEVKAVKNKVRDLESSIGETYENKSGQFSFGSITEGESYVTKSTLLSIDIYWDLFGILVSMTEEGKSGRDIADDKFSAALVSFTELETRLLATMTHL